MQSGRGTLSHISARRIQSELAEWLTSPPDCWTLAQHNDTDIRVWVLELLGTELYAGERFRLQVIFGDNYPMESPDFRFLPPHVPLHPHIYSNGHVCLDILYDGGPSGAWSPALTIASVCRSLQSMLVCNTHRERPEGDAEYCARVGNASAKKTRWAFHDDHV